jgi:hypothetical protein
MGGNLNLCVSPSVLLHGRGEERKEVDLDEGERLVGVRERKKRLVPNLPLRMNNITNHSWKVGRIVSFVIYPSR